MLIGLGRTVHSIMVQLNSSSPKLSTVSASVKHVMQLTALQYNGENYHVYYQRSIVRTVLSASIVTSLEDIFVYLLENWTDLDNGTAMEMRKE